MKRAEITVKGKVQRAGYRDMIDRAAYEHELTGYVKNLEDGTVKVVCEGEKEEIEIFLEKINIDKYPIKVTNIDVEYSEPTGEFEYFDVIREEDFTKAVYERMDIAADYLGNIYEETKKVGEETKKVHEETKKVGEETKKVHEVTKKVGEETKKVHEVTKKVHEETKKVGEETKKVHEETKKVGEETKKVHEETKKVGEETKKVGEKVDKGFSDVKEELGGKLDNISEKLDRSISHTEGFHNETVEKFDYLDVKYGEFSTTLNKLLNKFDVLENDIREMKDAFVKLVDHYTK
ncbi:MAG: acylphosphatase [Thermoplasmata archaeon]